MGGDSVKKVRTLNGDIPIFVPTSDTTLTVEGGFADAKAVGDKFAKTDDKIAQVKSDLAAETSRATAVEDTKADKTALARTDRSLDALWKLNQGVSYEFQKDEAVTYQKDIPTGAKLASVKKIGGRTIVWNQMVQNGDFSLNSMWSGLGSTVSVEGNTGIFTATEAALTDNKIEVYQILSGDVVKGHKYFARFEYNLSVDINDQSTLNLNNIFTKIPVVGAGTWGKFNSIVTVNVVNNVVNNIFDLYFFFDSLSVGDTVKLRNVQLFDLTRMFGPDNEPSTVEEFEALFPADYYPYNEGELLSMPVNEVMEQGRNLIDTSKCVVNSEAPKYNIYITLNPDGSFREHSSNYGDSSHRLCDYNFPIKKGKYYTFSIDKPIPYNIRLDNFVNIEAGHTYATFLTTRDAQITHIAIDAVRNESADFTVKPMLVRGKEHLNYSKYHKNSIIIPEKLVSLDGYGDGVTADVYNYIDWENKKYHKRVGKYTIDGSEDIYKEESYWVMTVTDFEKPGPSTKNAICVNFKTGDGYLGKWGDVSFRRESNGFVFSDSESKFANSNEVKDYFRQNNETIYYELNEEQIIDISDIVDNTFQEPIEVESGGSLTFRNTHGANYRVPVPNTVEYTVKLSEVAE